ncbi:hypothetical protein RclHR1_08620005 [Rhizophagus clarus]|uniref:Uncharacterized protein n=1 Tax=Rhizophagus clarus TaxID=94130 RepID=A0A2Z6SNT5_9GLOM|nr:hypothetical protein RclHR1_08620005 [Rhizophagus clarus]GES89745.1 hypothetical protein GLOIN_2v1611052 [Rhizophagus clarus]
MHKLQYEYIDKESNGEKKYAILDPSKKYSVISLSRLSKDGIDISKLSLDSVLIPDEMKAVVKVELNLLIGKEKNQKQVSAIVSEKSEDKFYLGNDFLSSYSVKKIGNTTKYYSRREIETEKNGMNENFYFSVEDYSRQEIETENNRMNENVYSSVEDYSSQEMETENNRMNENVYSSVEDYSSQEMETEKNRMNAVEEYKQTSKKLIYIFIISLIIAVSAIIIFNYQSSTDLLIGNMSLTMHASEFNFSEFLTHAEELGHEIISFELPSKEIMTKNVLDCNILVNRIDQIMEFHINIPQLMMNLNDLSSRLEIAKNSYTKVYTDGVYFFWVFEKCLNNILNYISNKSPIIYIHRRIDNNEEKSLSRSIEELFDALKTFISSVEEAYEDTLSAKSLQIGINEQVIKARLVFDSNNLSLWNKVGKYISSIFDKTREKSLIIGDEIAKTEIFIKNISDDLEGITKALLNFKENLEKYSNVFHNLLTNIGSLKRLRWNEHEIKKAAELHNMVKENHKNFKSKNFKLKVL